MTRREKKVRPTRPTTSMAHGGCWSGFGGVGESSMSSSVSRVLAGGAPRRVGKRWA